jgi:hypothetical protein
LSSSGSSTTRALVARFSGLATAADVFAVNAHDRSAVDRKDFPNWWALRWACEKVVFGVR